MPPHRALSAAERQQLLRLNVSKESVNMLAVASPPGPEPRVDSMRLPDLRSLVRVLRDTRKSGAVSLSGNKFEVVAKAKQLLAAELLDPPGAQRGDVGGGPSRLAAVNGLVNASQQQAQDEQQRICDSMQHSSEGVHAPFARVAQKLLCAPASLAPGVMMTARFVVGNIDAFTGPGASHAITVRLHGGPLAAAYELDRRFHLTCNSKFVQPRKARPGAAVRPVDITKFLVQGRNVLTIQYIPARDPRNASQSVVTNAVKALIVELATLVPLDELVRAREEEFEAEVAVVRRHEGAREQKPCEVCGTMEGLSRCSQCKQTWYCGEAHQRQHWGTHREECVPLPPLPASVSARRGGTGGAGAGGDGGEDDEDDIVALASGVVSLRCPLSMERMERPARGAACDHTACFELRSYLEIARQSGRWECPVCHRAAPLDDVHIDHTMTRIIRSLDDRPDVERVMLNADGSFEEVPSQRAGAKRGPEQVDAGGGDASLAGGPGGPGGPGAAGGGDGAAGALQPEAKRRRVAGVSLDTAIELD